MQEPILKGNASQVQFNPDDFPRLMEMAKSAGIWFFEQYPPNDSTFRSPNWDETESWPIRWKIIVSEVELEFIISEMGSVTLRLAQSLRYRRNPPPVFYISLGKSEDGSLQWESPERELVGLESSKIRLQEKVELYKKSNESLSL